MGSRKGMFGGLLLIIGAILLIVALLTSWYTITVNFNTSQSFEGSSVNGSGSSHIDLHPGSNYAISSSSSFTCTGAAASICPPSASTSSTCPYSGTTSTQGCSPAGLNKTGALYSLTEFMVIGGLALGFLAGILALISSSRPGMRKGAMALGIIALLLALVAPITLLAAQPGAIKSDTPNGSATNGSGPYSSFFGSCSSASACGGSSGGGGGSGSQSWGPAAGWYLSIVAFVLFLLGVMMVMRAGREPAPTPAPAPAAPMDNSMSSPPPANPPMGSS